MLRSASPIDRNAMESITKVAQNSRPGRDALDNLMGPSSSDNDCGIPGLEGHYSKVVPKLRNLASIHQEVEVDQPPVQDVRARPAPALTGTALYASQLKEQINARNNIRENEYHRGGNQAPRGGGGQQAEEGSPSKDALDRAMKLFNENKSKQSAGPSTSGNRPPKQDANPRQQGRGNVNSGGSGGGGVANTGSGGGRRRGGGQDNKPPAAAPTNMTNVHHSSVRLSNPPGGKTSMSSFGWG